MLQNNCLELINDSNNRIIIFSTWCHIVVGYCNRAAIFKKDFRVREMQLCMFLLSDFTNTVQEILSMP